MVDDDLAEQGYIKAPINERTISSLDNSRGKYQVNGNAVEVYNSHSTNNLIPNIYNVKIYTKSGDTIEQQFQYSHYKTRYILDGLSKQPQVIQRVVQWIKNNTKK